MGELRVIAGLWKGRWIKVRTGGRGETPRPTADRVRTSLFDRLTPQLPGACVLDLFAGSGALGIEALSRGAAHATFVENSAPTVRTLVENLRSLGLKPTGLAMTGLAPPERRASGPRESAEPATSGVPSGSAPAATTDIRFEDVFRALGHFERGEARFRIVFADPPYASGHAARLVTWFDESPLLEAGGLLVIEHDRREALPVGAGRLLALDERRYGDTVLSFYLGR